MTDFQGKIVRGISMPICATKLLKKLISQNGPQKHRIILIARLQCLLKFGALYLASVKKYPHGKITFYWNRNNFFFQPLCSEIINNVFFLL